VDSLSLFSEFAGNRALVVASIFDCQRTPVRSAHLGTGRSGTIIASGELGVCDGGHRPIVMKKGQSGWW
jgi:hypothetical protein